MLGCRLAVGLAGSWALEEELEGWWARLEETVAAVVAARTSWVLAVAAVRSRERMQEELPRELESSLAPLKACCYQGAHVLRVRNAVCRRWEASRQAQAIA